ncbi:translation initiation factor IF-2-like [Phyllostomus hastatus]|uniref:translation initiation factor IF-2-like n=1 Tax=Phyllostomus hastatus TaxID=9423 RepID=UPI001E682462|nr:translation initiation factor IF-2-like [Phyllostomus hastatus]
MGRLYLAPRLPRPARPYFYPPPSTPPRPPAAATPAAAERWPQSRTATPRDQAGGRDRRGLAARGGVSPPPPLGPEASPGSPGRPVSGPRGLAAARARACSAHSPVGSQCASGRDSSGKGRGSLGFSSVTVDASPSLRDQTDRRSTHNCHSPPLLPSPRRAKGAEWEGEGPEEASSDGRKEDKRSNEVIGREMQRKIQHKETHRKTLGQTQFWGTEGPSCRPRHRKTDLETQIQRLQFTREREEKGCEKDIHWIEGALGLPLTSVQMQLPHF